VAAVNEMRLPDFSVCLQAQAGIMPLKGKCIPRVQRVVLICLYLLNLRVCGGKYSVIGWKYCHCHI